MRPSSGTSAAHWRTWSPAERPITVEDLLSSRAGWGFPSDFTLPAVTPLITELYQGLPHPDMVLTPDEW